jgi:hypothetical protein
LVKLQNINAGLIDLLQDNNKYVNHYKPWAVDNKKLPHEITIPKEDKFNIATLCSEIVITHAIISSYNHLLYENSENLIQENKKNLLETIKILKEFLVNNDIQNNYNDIGINHIKRKIKEVVDTLLKANYGNDDYNSKFKVIVDKFFEEKMNNTIFDDIDSLVTSIKNN